MLVLRSTELAYVNRPHRPHCPTVPDRLGASVGCESHTAPRRLFVKIFLQWQDAIGACKDQGDLHWNE
jgi:hypothetical protein